MEQSIQTINTLCKLYVNIHMIVFTVVLSTRKRQPVVIPTHRSSLFVSSYVAASEVYVHSCLFIMMQLAILDAKVKREPNTGEKAKYSSN